MQEQPFEVDDFNDFVDAPAPKAGSYYTKPGVSNSSLGLINPEQDGSPLAFKNYVDNLVENKETYALYQGKLLHTWILEPEKFSVSEIDKITTQVGQFAELVFKYTRPDTMGVTMSLGTAYKLAFDTVGSKQLKLETMITKFETDENIQAYFSQLCKQDGKICIPRKMRDTLEACYNSVKGNPMAELLFMPSGTTDGIDVFSELQLFHEYQVPLEDIETGNPFNFELGVKGMLDKLIVNHHERKVIIPDLKTTGKAIFQFNRPGGAYQKYHYYRQGAFYEMLVVEALEKTTGVNIDGYDIEHRIIAVETNGLYQCKVFKPDLGVITKGTQEYENLLQRVAWHYANGIWHESVEEHDNGGEIPIRYDHLFTNG